MSSYFKLIVFSFFLLIIIPFLNIVNAQDLNSADYKACIENSYEVPRSCENRIQSDNEKSAYSCLAKLSADDTIWNCEPFDGETVLVNNCAETFANNVCAQIPSGMISRSCTDTCNQQYKEQFKALYTTKYHETNTCPTTVNNRIASVNNGAYDAFMRVTCNSFDLLDCQDKVLNQIKTDTQNQCNLVVDTNKSEIASAVSSRFTIAIPTPIPEAVNALDTLTNIIDRSQRRNCDPNESYLSPNSLDPLTCYEYRSCIYSSLSEVSYADDIWSCTDSDQSCLTYFRHAFENIYKQWVKTLSSDNQITSAKPEAMSCSGFFESSMIIETQNFEELYRSKRDERRNNNLSAQDKPVFKPLSTTDDFEELLNCGFADNKNKNRCCPTDIDLSDLSSQLTINELEGNQCMIPFVNEENCPSLLTSSGLQEKVVQLAAGDFQTKIDEIKALSEQDGGEIRECYVGTCNSNGFCEGGGGADVCMKYIDESEAAYNACTVCMQDNIGALHTKKIYTALGCIDTSFDGFIGNVFNIGIGIAGLTALFCIIYASFILQTSQGNPERIQQAQENLTSCITGLILVIFSVLILRVIGGDILRIPQFTQDASSSISPTVTPATTALQPTNNIPVSTSTPVPPTPTVTPPFQGAVTTSTTFFVNESNNYPVQSGQNIERIIGISPDGRYLQVDLVSSANIAPRITTGYILTSTVNYNATTPLVNFDTQSWLP